MKYLLCNVCGQLVQMSGESRQCICGNVSGRYLEDNHSISISVLYPKHAKVIGISNHFLLGLATYGEFKLSGLTGTFFDQHKSHIVMQDIESEEAKGSAVVVEHIGTKGVGEKRLIGFFDFITLLMGKTMGKENKEDDT